MNDVHLQPKIGRRAQFQRIAGNKREYRNLLNSRAVRSACRDFWTARGITEPIVCVTQVEQNTTFKINHN